MLTLADLRYLLHLLQLVQVYGAYEEGGWLQVIPVEEKLKEMVKQAKGKRGKSVKTYVAESRTIG